MLILKMNGPNLILQPEMSEMKNKCKKKNATFACFFFPELGKFVHRTQNFLK